MPFPKNVETARLVEDAARSAGVIPLTIAILDGFVHIGLSEEKLEKFAKLAEEGKVSKCTTRDLPTIIAMGGHGSTTVAATLFLAGLCGISLFVTGGTGGVHRGATETFDISADLPELARTPVALVSAGVKSILDIGKTLEVLETLGVPVLTLGQPEFPAFFTPKSEFPAPAQINSPEEAAKIILQSRILGLKSGVLVTVPVPSDEAPQRGPQFEAATKKALSEAGELGISGRSITPFLLKRINELTGGESLQQNIQLILNNVRTGAAIARHLNRLEREAAIQPSQGIFQQGKEEFSHSPVVCGGSNFDLLGRPDAAAQFLLKTSNSGTIEKCFGGVGSNIARALGQLGCRPLFLSAVGQDSIGDSFIAHAASLGVDTSAVLRIPGVSSSLYMAVLDKQGDLFTTIADMKCAEFVTTAHLDGQLSTLAKAPLAIVDGNLSECFIEHLSASCRKLFVPLLFEPTSIEKSRRFSSPFLRGEIDFVTPSVEELIEMENCLAATNSKTPEARASQILMKIPQAKLFKRVHLIVKLGADGVLVAWRDPAQPGLVALRNIPVPQQILPLAIVNTSGAGDSLVAAFAWRLIDSGAAGIFKALQAGELRSGPAIEEILNEAVIQAAEIGMRAAELTLEAPESVSSLIRPAILIERFQRVRRPA